MKSFDDFLSTISDDDYEKMLTDAVDTIKKRNSLSPATDNNDICLLQTIAILRHYHEWLTAQAD